MAQAALWVEPDTETRRHGERTGLETPVVHAVNDANSVFDPGNRIGYPSKRGKLAAWGVRSQD